MIVGYIVDYNNEQPSHIPSKRYSLYISWEKAVEMALILVKKLETKFYEYGYEDKSLTIVSHTSPSLHKTCHDKGRVVVYSITESNYKFPICQVYVIPVFSDEETV